MAEVEKKKRSFGGMETSRNVVKLRLTMLSGAELAISVYKIGALRWLVTSHMLPPYAAR